MSFLSASEVRDLEESLKRLEKNAPQRLEADDPEKIKNGLAQLVLALIELLRKLLEEQTLRRMEAGSLTDEQIEKMGRTLMQLNDKIKELQEIFGLEDDDLNIDLGPLGKLM